MHLLIDGLTEEWTGELGQFSPDKIAEIPFAIQILSSPVELRKYDSSGMGCGSSLYYPHHSSKSNIDTIIDEN